MTVYSKKTNKGLRWYFQFIQNREYHRGGGYPTKNEAREVEVKERNILSPHPKMDFGEVCDNYLTYIKDRNQSMGWVYEKKLFIKKHLKNWYLIPVDEITNQMIETLVIERGKQTSGYMGNKALKFLKAIMNFALDREWVDYNVCNDVELLPTEESLKYVPSLEDFLKVYDVANPKERGLLLLTFCTAGRIGEILDLKKGDIFQNYLILRSRKHREGSRKERKIPLNQIMRDTIEWLLERSGDSEYIISNPRERGNRFLRRPKLMHSLCKKAGVKFFGFHSIRHLATSELVDRGENLKTLQELLGHAKITTTGIYVHSIKDSLAMATEKLGSIFNGHSTKNVKTLVETLKKSEHGLKSNIDENEQHTET